MKSHSTFYRWVDNEFLCIFKIMIFYSSDDKLMKIWSRRGVSNIQSIIVDWNWKYNEFIIVEILSHLKPDYDYE